MIKVVRTETGFVEHLVFYSAEKNRTYMRELGMWLQVDDKVLQVNYWPSEYQQLDGSIEDFHKFERQEFDAKHRRIRENNYRRMEGFPLGFPDNDDLTIFTFEEEPGPEWANLISVLAAMITLAPEFVVLQTYTKFHNDCGPYIQTLREDEGALTIEASSNAFVDPPIGADAINTLLSMGWELPDAEDGLPNFTIFLEADEVEPGKVARFLVETLRRVFLVNVDDEFEFAPQNVFLDLVNGKYGDMPGIDIFLKPPGEGSN